MTPSHRRAAFVAFVAFVALLSTLAPSTAFAQGNHRLAPVGGRTTIVGGTGLAYGSDSAAAFLNPATVVRVDPGRLAFSVTFYRLTLVSAPHWYQPGAIDRAHFGDVPSEGASGDNAELTSLPGSLCLYLRVGDIKGLAGKASKELRERRARLGLCLASVESSSYAFNDEAHSRVGAFGVSRQAGSTRQSFARFAIGPTYAMWIDNALALGASLHFKRTTFRNFIGNTSTLYGGDTPISSAMHSASRGDAHALSLTMGATYRIGKRQTVALAVELPSVHLFGSGGIDNYSHFDGAATTGTSALVASGDFATHAPLRVAIGTGIEGTWGTAELNVSFHAPVGEAYRAEFQGRSYDAAGAAFADRAVSPVFTARSRGAVNVGVGGEYFTSPGFSVLGGLGTDISAVPRGALGKDPFNYFSAETYRVFGSVGVGSHGDGGDLLFGGELSYGWGERLAPNAYVLPARLDPTLQRQYALTLVLAGSTSFKNISRAVADVGHVLDPSGIKKRKAPKPP